METIYIVGAQCTGKTTLSKALAECIAHRFPQIKCKLLCETARTTLQLHNFSREDVRGGGERCLLLQKLIMDSQLERETAAQQDSWDVVISDRSGFDPLVYAHMYCESDLVERLTTGKSWKVLRSMMKGSVVVVCEPVQDWLVDDGTRLVPESGDEWTRTHELFCELLNKHGVPYEVLPSSLRSLEDRVEFVLRQTKTHRELSSKDGCSSPMVEEDQMRIAASGGSQSVSKRY